MKIKENDFNELAAGINKVLANNPGIVNLYESGQFYNSHRVNNLQKRFCFDAWTASMVQGFNSQELMTKLYSYMDDSHIYTALKKICPAVTRKY
jgi:hypothetical protein